MRITNILNRLTSLTIPDSVTFIGEAFNYCKSLTTFNYEGTVEEWNNIVKDEEWDRYSNWGKYLKYTVYCTDGKIESK